MLNTVCIRFIVLLSVFSEVEFLEANSSLQRDEANLYVDFIICENTFYSDTADICIFKSLFYGQRYCDHNKIYDSVAN